MSLIYTNCYVNYTGVSASNKMVYKHLICLVLFYVKLKAFIKIIIYLTW